MCAYNIRKNKSVGHEPARGRKRALDFIDELAVVATCLGAMYLVYLLGKRFLQ
ncbi:MAG: hypothetical protein ACREMO_01975 [Gemmatimonadales bacterium]